jgi:FkbM family methyltransferase
LPRTLLSILSKLGFNPKNKYISLYIKGYENPIWARYQSSDIDVLYQIFGEEEYSCLDNLDQPKLILDCGANVGYSSIYLLNKYPTAHVIAVEPDDENFIVCQKNLLPYSERVSLVRSAIWSHEVGLVVSKGVDVYGDGCEWATQVKECQGDQKPDLLATDILSLLKKSEFTSIDLLKVDIEGAEVVIFSQNYETWLNRVKNIVIELHSEECKKSFFNALSPYKYDLSRSGELTVCKGILPKTVSIS